MAIRQSYRILSTIVRIASAVNLSFPKRLKSIAKVIRRSFQLESATIYLVDEEGNSFSHRISHSGAAKLLPCVIPLGVGAAGECLAQRKEVLKERDGLCADEMAGETEQKILSIPVPSGNNICGVLSLGLSRDGSLTTDETKLLKDIAVVVGNLIQRKMISEFSDRRVRNLITLNSLVKELHQSVPLKSVPAFVVRTCHENTGAFCTVLRILRHDGFPSGVFRRCRRSSRAVLTSLLEREVRVSADCLASGMSCLATDLIADEELPLSYVCVPLSYESRVLGTLTFFGKLRGDGKFSNFDEEDRDLFESMAAPVAAALEVAAKYRLTTLLDAQNDRKLRELSLLYRISNAMHSTIKLNDLVQLALNVLVTGRVPMFERAMLFLVNERAGVIQGMLGVTTETSRGIIKTADDGEPLFSAHWEIPTERLASQYDTDFSRQVKEIRLPLDKSLNASSRAILEKKLIHVHDATVGSRIDTDFVQRLDVTDFVAVPLMAKDEVLGLVVVDNHLTRKPITRDDLRFLQLVLNQTGMAIENSMLYNRIEDANRDFREVQQRLIQGEKLAAIGEMAASIAHELKGPLVSIGGFAKRLERKLAHNSTEWKYADTIAREAGRLEKMLTDTLLFSKKAVICSVPCNVNVILDESLSIVSTLLEEKKIKVKFRPNEHLDLFYGDFPQLKQVFINLFANAAEAMKDGGTLSVAVSPARLDGAGALSVSITDTGGGIPLDILNNIFNPFFTTKDSGTGLGLPISHMIVSNHGGKILVYNRPGSGAQFKVVLPLQPKAS